MNVNYRRMYKCVLTIVASIASIHYSTANACNGILDDTTSAVGTHDGFYYNFWRQTSESNVQISCGDKGNFSANWSNVFNLIGGKGWSPEEGPQVVSYSGTFGTADYQHSQTSHLMLYGWTKDPLVEYQIVESYGSWNPSGCAGVSGNLGSFQSGGVSYDILKCRRHSQGGFGPDYDQYFSVRNPPLAWGKVSGTITVADHFNEWVKYGMDLGTHDYMMLAVDIYNGDADTSGSFNLTVNEGPLEPLAPQCGSQGGVPICCSIHADPDRDGMGEENGEVCSVTSVTQGVHPDNPPDVLAAINVGGNGDAIEHNGIWYEPSTYVTTSGLINRTKDYVSGAYGGTMFQSEVSGEMKLSIPISHQQVSVELSFVEFKHTEPGARAFDVTIENQRVLENIDLFAEVGHDTVWRPSPFEVDVTDGTLNIDVHGVVGRATLSSVLVRKSTNSSGGEAAGVISAWFLLIMASGLLAMVRRFSSVKNS